MYRMVLRLADGRDIPVDGHHDSLQKAFGIALNIADRDEAWDYEGPEPAKWVRIYDDDCFLIGIEVLSGGLTGPREA